MASDQKQDTKLNFVRPDNELHVSEGQHVCSSVLYALVYCTHVVGYIVYCKLSYSY